MAVSDSTMSGNGTGIHAEDASVRLDHVTIEDSAMHGVSASKASSLVLTDMTVAGSGASGVKAEGGSVEVRGGTYAGNGVGSPSDFVDRAGVHVSGDASLVMIGAVADGNVQDDIVVLDDAAATLDDVRATNVPGLGAGLYASTRGTVVVRGGAFDGNHNGLYLSGDTDASVLGVSASRDRYAGMSFRSTGSLTVRDSEFVEAGRYNVQIRNSPAVVDLGTTNDPGNNQLWLGPSTLWSLSDERPARPSADGPVLTAHSVGFRDTSGALVVFSGPRTGPGDSGDPPHWRITGSDERLAF